MFEGRKQRPFYSLGWIGVAGTVLYLAVIAIFQWDNIYKIQSLTLNEFGDFLAGAFGPLAIFWIVLGFFQQGDELRNSVATLELQAKELAASVEQQRELVQVTREQLEHERDTLRTQETARKKAIQPVFSIALKASSGIGDDRGKFVISLTNTGRPASELIAVLVYDTKEVIHFDIRYFETGAFQSRPLFGDDYVHRPRNQFELRISYRDADGELHERLFSLLPGENKKLFDPFLVSARP